MKVTIDSLKREINIEQLTYEEVFELQQMLSNVQDWDKYKLVGSIWNQQLWNQYAKTTGISWEGLTSPTHLGTITTNNPSTTTNIQYV